MTKENQALSKQLDELKQSIYLVLGFNLVALDSLPLLNCMIFKSHLLWI